MTATAGPTTLMPSHDITLSDGTTTIGLLLCDAAGKHNPEAMNEAPFNRSAMQISSGAPGYSDMVLPYTVYAQDDWSGGRGWEDFAKDTTKYYDGNATDTTKANCVIHGPLAAYTTGYYSSLSNVIKNGDYAISTHYFLSNITPAANISVRRIAFQFKGLVGSSLVEHAKPVIYSDSSGPSTILVQGDLIKIVELETYITFTFDIPATTLTAGTKYWVGVYLDSGIAGNLGKKTSSTGDKIYYSANGSSWSYADNTAIAFTLYTQASGTARYFEYKGALYVVTAPDDQTAPTLWMNGHRGKAKDNAADLTKLNTGLNLTGVDLTGCIAMLVDGPGSGEDKPYRTITSNTTTGTNDVITVNQAWKITHTTDTSFVILGCSTWQEVTGHGLTKPVTDVCVTDDIVWFAQGDENTAKIRSMKWDTTYSFHADTANYAGLLKYYVDDAGVGKIQRAAYISTDKNHWANDTVPAWAADFSFVTGKDCGSSGERITGLTVYADDNGKSIPYVLKEGSFGSISTTGVYAEQPNSEMHNVRSLENGKASLRHDMYLYFNISEGLERYLDGHLDDMGPNRDAGMPHQRHGVIRHMVGYPGRFYVCVDAGDETDHYSSILCYNTMGWHEIYRAPGGKRIRFMYIQALPGLGYQRLWVSEEEDLIWLPVSINPEKEPDYRYCASCSIVTAWIDGGMKDIIKFWHSLKLYTDFLSTAHQTILAEYQVDNADDDDAWITIGTYVTSPFQEMDVTAAHTCTGRRIRFRLTSTTDNSAITTKIKALVVEAVVRYPPKSVWTPTFLLGDYEVDANGVPQASVTATADHAQLKTWANSGTQAAPLLMRSNNPMFDNKRVFIESASVTPLKALVDTSTRTVRSLARMTVQEA